MLSSSREAGGGLGNDERLLPPSHRYHGVRPGVTALQLEQYGAEAPPPNPPLEEGARCRSYAGKDEGDETLQLYDWFGSMADPRRRGRERLSIIFAFDDPE